MRKWMNRIFWLVIAIYFTTYVVYLILNRSDVEPPQDFIKKTEIAKEISNKQNYGAVLKTDEGFAREREGRYQRACTKINYNGAVGTGSGVRCYRSFTKYFGVEQPNAQSIDALHNQLIQQGWSPTDSPVDYASSKDNILLRTARVSGFSYKNADGLKMGVSYMQRNASGQRCSSQVECKLLDTTKGKQHDAIIVSTIGIETLPFEL